MSATACATISLGPAIILTALVIRYGVPFTEPRAIALCCVMGVMWLGFVILSCVAKYL